MLIDNQEPTVKLIDKELKRVSKQLDDKSIVPMQRMRLTMRTAMLELEKVRIECDIYNGPREEV